MAESSKRRVVRTQPRILSRDATAVALLGVVRGSERFIDVRLVHARTLFFSPRFDVVTGGTPL